MACPVTTGHRLTAEPLSTPFSPQIILMQKITIATRGSELALWQANHVKSCLEAEYEGIEVDLLVIKTQGDKILDVPLAKIGGKGLFVKEIEEALLDGRADIAVHSMKDVPVELPAGLSIGCVPLREVPTDMFLSVNFDSLDDLPEGSVVGTSSLRRQSQLLAMRPDLTIKTLRGNINTRMRKLMEGQFDAIIMATSGLKRIGLTAPKMSELGPPRFLPAVGQGALGIEFRDDREDISDLLDFLSDDTTHVCVDAERGFLTGLEGGCQVPIAAYATLDEEQDLVTLTGLVASPDGKEIIRRVVTGDAEEAFETGQELALAVLEEGGREILEAVYAEGNPHK